MSTAAGSSMRLPAARVAGAALVLLALAAGCAPSGARAFELEMRTCLGGAPCRGGCADACDAAGGCDGGACAPFANACGERFCSLVEFCGADGRCHPEGCESRRAHCAAAQGAAAPAACPPGSGAESCVATPDGAFSCSVAGGVAEAFCGGARSRGFEMPADMQAQARGAAPLAAAGDGGQR
ncbi:MAG: hypothetical protein J3K34DRAFT_459056, partial [Monoraphidium minutum]